MSTKVSIIVPVYKARDYIERCINSVIAQSFKDWEMILIDDCGGDGSMDIVKDYASREHRVKFIESKKNCGPMMAREKGYKKSKGEYITFLDSDDTLPVNALQCLYNVALGNNSDIVVGEMLTVDPKGNYSKRHEELQNGTFDTKSIIPFLINGVFPHNLCGKLFRATLLRDNNLYSIDGCTNGEDGLLFYQLLSKTEWITVISSPVYLYWMNEGSSTHKELTAKMISGMARLEKFKNDFFLNEGYPLEKPYYSCLYKSISNIATRFPLSEVLSIYREHGLVLDVSIKNLFRYFSGKELLIVVTKTYCGYKLNKIRKIL